MIKIALGTPVVLVKHIPEIAEESGYSREDIVALLTVKKHVVVADYPEVKKGTLLSKEGSTKAGIAEGDVLTGSEALLWIYESQGKILPVVREVDIPAAVYYEAPRLWTDISALAAQVATRADRLAMLVKINAPQTILECEKRDLMERVNILEDTSFSKNPPRSESGRMRRCLADVGYSLLTGWSPDMIAEFDRREAEMEASAVIEDAEEEPVESEA